MSEVFLAMCGVFLATFGVFSAMFGMCLVMFGFFFGMSKVFLAMSDVFLAMFWGVFGIFGQVLLNLYSADFSCLVLPALSNKTNSATSRCVVMFLKLKSRPLCHQHRRVIDYGM